MTTTRRPAAVGRPRLGIYCPGIGVGGPWRYVHSILRRIDTDEFDVTLFCDLEAGYEPRPTVRVVQLSGPPAGVVPQSREARVAPGKGLLRHVVPGPVRLWAGFWRTARRLARHIRGERLDLFHTQNTGCEESPVAARLAGVPRVVGTFHVNSKIDLRGVRGGARHRLLEFVSNQCLDTAIAVSRDTANDWVRRSRISPARVVTIHNGIDPETYRRRLSPAAARERFGLPVDGPVIGAVGRLDEAKGLTYLLDAAARLRPEFPALRVVLAGDGPLRPQLEARTAQLGLAGAVRFLGFQHDVQPVMDALDVFALPSLSETLGYAFLEAMATELPAVGTRVGGIPEVIVDGETGVLVPPRDAAALANGIAGLLRSPATRRRMGAAGRERVVRRFNEQDMVRRTLDVYRTALHRGPAIDAARQVRTMPLAIGTRPAEAARA